MYSGRTGRYGYHLARERWSGHLAPCGHRIGAFLALPLTLLALPVAWLLDRASSRHLGRQVRVALAGDPAGDERVGLVLFALALTLTTSLSFPGGLTG